MTPFQQIAIDLLGLHTPADQLQFRQMALRCVIVLLTAVFAGRLADRRSIGANAAFDVMMGVVLGSVLSRGINGQAPFFPSLGVSVVFVLLHRLLARFACRSHMISCLVKGRAALLVKDGIADEEEMRKNAITRDDLIENLRMNGNIGEIRDVKEAWFERDGKISVIRREKANQ